MVKLCILALMAIAAYTYAAVARFRYEPKPAEFANQSGCFLSSLNRVLPYNVPYYPKGNGTCLQYTCGTDNETELFSCGAVGLPKNCHLEKDYTLDYPKCCGSPVCTPTTTTTTEEPCVTVTEPPCDHVEPTTEEPTTETCVTVTAVAR